LPPIFGREVAVGHPHIFLYHRLVSIRSQDQGASQKSNWAVSLGLPAHPVLLIRLSLELFISLLNSLSRLAVINLPLIWLIIVINRLLLLRSHCLFASVAHLCRD
jgi:hypothetical protein